MLPLMLNKIRLGGQLVLVIQDIKSLASMYASNSINDEDLLLKVKNLKNIISLPKIEKLVNDKQEFVLINLQTQNNQHTVVLQREKI
jgi:hypothetical protein